MRAERVLVEKNVAIPLRDGVITHGDLYRPADGPPQPAVIARTPYDKEQISGMPPVMASPLKLAERGYAAMVIDTRGRFSSQGEFEPFVHEGRDGYDTIEWVAAQPWCDGNVAIFGASYLGATTLLAARERPPALRCAIPIVTAADYYDGWVYQSGAFELGFSATWSTGLAAASLGRPDQQIPAEHAQALLRGARDPGHSLATRPLCAYPGLSAAGVAPYYVKWLGHPNRDGFWDSIRPSLDYAAFDVPMLHLGGWFDIFGNGTIRNFQGLHAAANGPQHLWMGPWAHTVYTRHLGDIDHGAGAAAADCGVIRAYNRFLDRHLRGRASDAPAVHYFLMGANEWRDTDAWPPSAGRALTLYLHSGGRANGARGDGLLYSASPDGAEPPDRYVYDPERPVPTEGGAILQMAVGLPGPRDQSALEMRNDVLCYTTAPLTQPLIVAGPVTLTLWAVSDAPDTDWSAKLVDVRPDGTPLSLCDGILRARFRESFTEPQPLTPSEPAQYTIELGHTAFRFDAGHRLRLEISSSNFPRFDANPNTGGVNATETETRPALQHILHDADRPSAVTLWALPE